MARKKKEADEQPLEQEKSKTEPKESQETAKEPERHVRILDNHPKIEWRIIRHI